MPLKKPVTRVLGVAAMLVAVLGVGLWLVPGSASAAVAQEDTTTTTVADATDTTGYESVTESTDESEQTDRSPSGDHDCEDKADGAVSDDSSSSG